MLVAPSILSANFNRLEEEVKDVYRCGATYLHVDVMDGHFVPNISLGPVVYRNLVGIVPIVFDVHLMISDPDFYAKRFVEAGADILTFHYEAVTDVMKTIDKIKKLDVKVGISIKPNTKVEEILEYLPFIDLVLVMSVEPGFGGQEFIPSALVKIKELKDYRNTNNLNYLIEVDGGINYQNAKKCKDNGCDIVVAGTYIFKSVNREKTIKELLEI